MTVLQLALFASALLLVSVGVSWTQFPQSDSSADSFQLESIGSAQRKIWHDSLDPHSERDRRLAKELRGDRSERVHYMDSIAPTDDGEWISACISGPIEDKKQDAAQRVEQLLNKHRNGVSAKSIASIRALDRKQHKSAESDDDDTPPPLTFLRDAAGRHHYPHPPPSSTPSGLLDHSNPFGFAHRPRRDPARACKYSAKYREENAHRCENIKHTEKPGKEIKAPFKEVSFTLKKGKDTSCAAWGWFSNDLLTSGWNYLYVETNPTVSDAGQARAAGLIEGALTTQPIWEHHVNEFQVLFTNDGVINPLTKEFINDMTDYNMKMVAAYGATDPYWAQVGLVYQQIQGMFEGYGQTNTDPAKQISYFDFVAIQYDGDMSDIQATVGASAAIYVDDSLQTIMDYLIRNGHCSALIKLTDGNNELFAAHDTWAGFSSTHRMFKAYRMPLTNVSTTAVHFSSYPAFVSSTDDWYQTLESQLTILETTNDIVNQSLYSKVDTSAVGTWARAIVASRLATGGDDWAGYFGKEQSGTYNNQWMIVDYSLFNSGAAIVPNTLWVLEVYPGSVFSADVSDILQKQMYWASYNRPWFPAVYTAMGYASLNATYGPYLFGYSRYFRAEIFAREQPNIAALIDMQRVMSLNKWQTDPLSRNNSGFAISSRFDLSTYDPIPSLGFFYRGAWGAYDVKITNSQWNLGLPLIDSDNTLRVSTHSGPTHWDQPVFTWNDPEWANYSSHIGLPQTYDFDFIQLHLIKA